MNVAIVQDPEARYPADAPFHPDESYPELALLAGHRAGAAPNPVYRAVREGLRLLGFDAVNFGTPRWNPLRGIVRPGDKVLVKPNLVLHESATYAGSNALFTHASVLRPILDYVRLATGGEGVITVADCPLQEADMAAILRANGLQALLDWYRTDAGTPVEFVDFRLDRMTLAADGRVLRRETAGGDPRGNVTVRVDALSELEPITRPVDRFSSSYGQDFAVALYDKKRTTSHHRPGGHEYLIPRTVLDADVVINVPKLKTHQKAGLTVCLKNLVGMNADKSYLPHYREGSADEGGDEYPHRHWLTSLNHRMRNRLASGNSPLWVPLSRSWRLLKRTLLTPGVLGSENPVVANLGIAAGAWDGNDTLWRTIMDLNTILFFADSEGRIGETPRRRYLAIVDGIVAGEGNGPLLPVPRAAGLVLIGEDPLALDVTAARLFGFDWEKIPQLRQSAARDHHRFSGFRGDTASIRPLSNDRRWSRLFEQDEDLGFLPPPGWSRVRRAPAATAAAAGASPAA